jgi:hypothetical protein
LTVTIDREELASLGLQQVVEKRPPAWLMLGYEYVLEPLDVFVSDEPKHLSHRSVCASWRGPSAAQPASKRIAPGEVPPGSPRTEVPPKALDRPVADG